MAIGQTLVVGDTGPSFVDTLATPAGVPIDLTISGGSDLSTATAKADGQPKSPSGAPTFGRTIRIAVSSWTSTDDVTVTVTGIDPYGAAVSEALVIPAGATAPVEGSRLFASIDTGGITWVTPAGWTAGTFKVQTGTRATVEWLYRITDRSRAQVVRAGVVTDAPNGGVRYDWIAADTTTAALFDAQWRVTTGLGTHYTVPPDGPIQFRVARALTP